MISSSFTKVCDMKWLGHFGLVQHDIVSSFFVQAADATIPIPQTRQVPSCAGTAFTADHGGGVRDRQRQVAADRIKAKHDLQVCNYAKFLLYAHFFHLSSASFKL